jgi:hypothetical protein
MSCYERVAWDSEGFRGNLDLLVAALSAPGTGGPDGALVADLEEIARQPGPLNRRLAYASEAGVSPNLVARLTRMALAARPGATAPEIIETILPVLRWRFGVEGLTLGLDAVGPASGALLADQGEGAVRALWLIGLLRLADRTATWEFAAEDLRAMAPDGRGRDDAYAAVLPSASSALREVWQELCGDADAPSVLAGDPLWANAVVMGHRHSVLEGGAPGVFAALLRHAASGGEWPLDGEENTAFAAKARAAGAGGRVLDAGAQPISLIGLRRCRCPLCR